MAIIRIKMTRDLEALSKKEVDPEVLRLTNGKRVIDENNSALAGVCLDMSFSYKGYERTTEGCFFVTDEGILKDTGFLNLCSWHCLKFEVIK